MFAHVATEVYQIGGAVSAKRSYLFISCIWNCIRKTKWTPGRLVFLPGKTVVILYKNPSLHYYYVIDICLQVNYA